MVGTHPMANGYGGPIIAAMSNLNTRNNITIETSP